MYTNGHTDMSFFGDIRQHDDHCYFIVYGREWRVWKIEQGRIHVWRIDDVCMEFGELDMSQLRLDEYCAEAARMLKMFQ